MGLSVRAMWQYKCPRCRDENVRLFKQPFEISKPLDMESHCAHCGQNFEPEPGFYYGAMFLSYIISSFILLPIALILVFYFDWSDFAAMGFVILLGAVMFFRVMRVSRSLWIHLMVKYNPSK